MIASLMPAPLRGARAFRRSVLHRSRSFLSLLAATTLAASCLVAPSARAQSNAALAERLFLDGQKLMAAGDYATACSKFADSRRLDPALGTLMHLAACHEKMGKFATAWSEFTDAAAQAQKAGQAEREKYARDRATVLDSHLQKMIIELSRPPEGTVIKLDGGVLPLGVLGTEVPLDPGDHALEVTAPGKKSWHQDKLNLGPSAVVTRVLVNLEDDPSAPPPGLSGPTETGPHPTQGPESSVTPTSTTNTTKQVLGYGIGGAGVVSLGIAVAEEVTSIGRKNDESKYPAQSSQRQTVADQSSAAQTYAIVFGAAGAVAVGAGLYLVLTSHEAPAPRMGDVHVTPLVGRGVAGAGVDFVW
jgi:hypothetical protein